jgi:hypothetical protein
MGHHELHAAQARAGLPREAMPYLYGVVAAAGAATLAALGTLEVGTREVVTFLLLGAAAAIAQLLVVETGKNHGFPTAIAFLLAGTLLLPPAFIPLLVLAQHAPDVVLRRFPWYIQTFNCANYTLNGLAAWATARVFLELGPTGGEVEWGAALAGCAVFVAINHLLLGVMLMLARGHRLRDSGLFSVESVSIDLVMAIIGVALVALSTSNAALIVVALVPLLLADRLLRLMAAAGAARVHRGQPAS